MAPATTTFNISVAGVDDANTITGGTGDDTFAYSSLAISSGEVSTITDFETGSGGDEFEFDSDNILGDLEGTEFEAVASGATLGASTGMVVYITAVSRYHL